MKQSGTITHYDMGDERTYYQPRWFEKVETTDEKGERDYYYKPKTEAYWEARDKRDWQGVPRIFDDDCEAFM